MALRIRRANPTYIRPMFFPRESTSSRSGFTTRSTMWAWESWSLGFLEMKNTFVFAVVLLAVAASARPTLAQRGQNQTLGRLAPTDTSDRPQINVESYAIDLTIDPEDHAIKATADLQFRQLERKNFATF